MQGWRTFVSNSPLMWQSSSSLLILEVIWSPGATLGAFLTAAGGECGGQAILEILPSCRFSVGSKFLESLSDINIPALCSWLSRASVVQWLEYWIKTGWPGFKSALSHKTHKVTFGQLQPLSLTYLKWLLWRLKHWDCPDLIGVEVACNLVR